MQARGHTSEDFAVAGGGGDVARKGPKSRVVSGSALAAAQIKGSPGRSKSTLLNMIAGLDSPTCCEICIGEREITHLPSTTRGHVGDLVHLQWQPWHPHLFPVHTDKRAG